jgi:hypothetical protein
MPITSSPPPTHGGNSGVAAVRKVSAAVTKKREEALADLGTLAQVPLIALKQYADVGAVNLHWPNVAREVAKLAEQEESIAKIIDPLMMVGPYAGLVSAVLPLILQLGVNHGRMSAGAMNTVPPSALGSQVEAAIAQQEVAALRVQLESEKEANAVRKEIDKARRDMIAMQQKETAPSE